MSRIEQAIARYHRDPAARYGILFLDLDEFKQVNDNYGHLAGDAFLCEIAARLKRCVREVDTVARLGGDEFVVLFDGVGDSYDLGAAADRVADELSVPFAIGQNTVVPTASIGVMAAREDIAEAEEALRNADIAMYRAKADGKNKRVDFSDEMLSSVRERNRLRRDLRTAIGSGEITLHFQPIVRLDGPTAGWEVLARWAHGELGRIGPDRFIPLAEESGLIVPLGTFVLLETLRTAATLRDGGLLDFPVGGGGPFFAVNVSAVQIGQPDFSSLVLSALERHGLPPAALHIELTESSLIDNREAAVAVIERLSAEGVSFKLDDFGTGYSSLGYLDRIPLHTVKIDRSFINRLGAGADGIPSSDRLVRGIISLSHDLGKTVVAEGIETFAQAERLKAYGCDFGQGYFFGKPVGFVELAEALAETSPAARSG